MSRVPLRLTPRKAGSPQGRDIEGAARDAALDNLAAYRGALCEAGRAVAIELCQQRGRVTSVEVFAEMRARGYDEALDAVDPRWMGVVFHESIWERQGWEQTGSHKRPVAIWGLVNNNPPPSPRMRVYRTIELAGTAGRTDEQIALATGLTSTTVKKQLMELEAGALVFKSAMRRRRVSGRKAPVYLTWEYDPEIV